MWSRNGRELFYISLSGTNAGQIMVVNYTPIQLVGNNWPLDLAPDGKRFVVYPPDTANGAEKTSVHVTVLQNFFDELKRRVPIK
jgi:hypothetical protein